VIKEQVAALSIDPDRLPAKDQVSERAEAVFQARMAACVRPDDQPTGTEVAI